MARITRRRRMRRRYRLPAGLTARQPIVKTMSNSYKNGNVYKFKRKRASSITVEYDGATTESHGVFKFMLSDVPNSTEFTALFDKYRITGIKAQFFPRTNTLSQNNLTGTLTECPPILTVVDYDDAAATGDSNVLMQYENCRVHSEFKPFSVFFRPMIALATYSSGAFSGYSSSRKQWIDAASPDVEYYALKWASLTYAIANSTTIEVNWDVVFTYYIECKYPR